CHGHSRTLHSFPTRRSSDLGDRDVSREESCVAAGPIGVHALIRPHRLLGPWDAIAAASSLVRTSKSFLTRAWASAVQGADADGRSEEHTSELQSLTNLVCRL